MIFSGNRYIPFHAVSYVRGGGEDRMEIHLSDGDLVKVPLREFEREWAKASCHVVAAQPGYDAVSRVQADGRMQFRRTPIVAFRIDEAGAASPILLDPSEANRFEAIRYPDGRVLGTDGGHYDDLERWAEAAG